MREGLLKYEELANGYRRPLDEAVARMVETKRKDVRVFFDFNKHDLVSTHIISDVKAGYKCKCGAVGGTHMATHLASPAALIKRAEKNHELHQVRALTKMLKEGE